MKEFLSKILSFFRACISSPTATATAVEPVPPHITKVSPTEFKVGNPLNTKATWTTISGDHLISEGSATNTLVTVGNQSAHAEQGSSTQIQAYISAQPVEGEFDLHVTTYYRDVSNQRVAYPSNTIKVYFKK